MIKAKRSGSDQRYRVVWEVIPVGMNDNDTVLDEMNENISFRTRPADRLAKVPKSI